ncbi:(2Fe-2S)-binding protein [Pseudalkalibacillus salsuginis]|uniref:(2Fe-2S)-binding protein n=1 Tax=Pseudalkalibacillus salsuginis TaxID=2910972 RepID=UPI001F38D198|nr:(2Fe-2S)-binding protein [Pseudalkalibacillus salsuginis]MCF6409527.1 (2Fe-2S)-binding protein [Pseudalkalibacillus salsuginis]
MTMRVEYHPVLGNLENQRRITIYFDDQAYQAYEGDTIASAMMAEGVKTLRYHEVSGKGRGVYCNIGHCFECRVRVNEENIVRACLTPVSEGMRIHSLS